MMLAGFFWGLGMSVAFLNPLVTRIGFNLRFWMNMRPGLLE